MGFVSRLSYGYVFIALSISDPLNRFDIKGFLKRIYATTIIKQSMDELELAQRQKHSKAMDTKSSQLCLSKWQQAGVER